MALNFPSAPTLGQKYPSPAVVGIPTYTWDGEKWTTNGAQIAYAPPAAATPLMDATPAVVGVANAYAREDHVHPSDTSRVAKAGDAMSGPLAINKSASGQSSNINGQMAGVQRWTMRLGNTDPEGGANSGSNFAIESCADNGASLGTMFRLLRSTGEATFWGDVGIYTPTPRLGIGSATNADAAEIAFTQDKGNRWALSALGTTNGDDFALGKFSAADGTFQGFPLRVSMATGGVTFGYGITVAAGLTVSSGDFKVSNGNAVIAGYLTVTNVTFPSNQGVTFTGGGYIYRDPSGVIVNTGGGGVNAFAWNNNANTVERMRLTDGGQLLINRSGGGAVLNNEMLTISCPSTVLGVAISAVDRGYGVMGSSTGTYGLMCFQGAVTNIVGSVFFSNTATSFNTTSDGRLKEDLKSFDAGKIIDATKVYDFAWKDTSERSYGVVAQEAKDVYPSAFNHYEDDDLDRWFVDYSKYVPLLIQEIKSLRARVRTLEGDTVAKPA